jgi:DNA polymerase-1
MEAKPDELPGSGAIRQANSAIRTAAHDAIEPRPDAADSCGLAAGRAVTTLADQTVWVIDAHALIFQVFHAIPEMTSPRGEPVNAVFGFTRDVLYLLEQKKPDYLFCAFDMSGPTFRHTLFGDYKLQRSEMPSDLRPQIPLIRQVLETLGLPILEYDAYEADDILATVARRCEELGGLCYLVTNDKDCRQLISNRTWLYNVRKNQLFDADALAADWGIRPDQVVDFQALVGDPIDNVPGVPLIGPKLARDLLNQYGTLEEILKHAEAVPGEKRRQNLIAGREQALLSRELTRLTTDLPLTIPWEEAHVSRLKPQRLLPLFGELGFHTFAEKVRAWGGREPQKGWKVEYRIVDTPDKLRVLVAELAKQTEIAISTETTDLLPMRAALTALAVSWQPGVAYYLPLATGGEPRLDLEPTLQTLRPVFENPKVKKLGQNLKYHMVVLRRYGIELAGLGFDTMIASYLLDAGERNHTLEELAKRYLDHNTTRWVDLVGSGKNPQPINQVDVASRARFTGEEVDVVLRLRPILESRLKEWKLVELLGDIELPLVEVLVELESNGIRVDAVRLAELSKNYGQRMEHLEKEIYALAGHEFHIGSPKQLQTVLFAELKLPVLKRTKTGPSTDADVLEQLAAHHELPRKIIEYRGFAKLKSTYVDALPGLINPRTGRVHACFNQVVAATGRLSSSDPNLQNIPIRNEAGREIRAAFLPGEEGWRLLAADYSQIELRVLAHFSEDPTLCAAFAEDADIHTLVASQVYGVPLDQVTREMRYSAKAVNFGVLYGQSAFGLAQQLSIEAEQAAAFIDAYFHRYRGVERYLARVLAECCAKNYVTTLFGRRRAIRGVRPNVGRQLNLAERTAINTVIQGSAADLIKKAMIAIHRRLRAEKRAARMLLQIHDELVFEAPVDELKPLATLVSDEMTRVAPLRVPLKVDVKSGSNWAEVEPWDLN